MRHDFLLYSQNFDEIQKGAECQPNGNLWGTNLQGGNNCKSQKRLNCGRKTGVSC